MKTGLFYLAMVLLYLFAINLGVLGFPIWSLIIMIIGNLCTYAGSYYDETHKSLKKASIYIAIIQTLMIPVWAFLIF